MIKPNLFLVERNNKDKKKFKIIHPFDGRVTPLYPERLAAVSRQLASLLDIAHTDYIVGFAEGGLLPAYGVSSATNLPMVGSYRVRLKLPYEITFQEPHSERSTHYIYGLREGNRVVIVEDETTTGSTILNAIKAFHQNGINVIDIGTFIMAVKESPHLKEVRELGYDIKYLYNQNDFE